MKTARMASSHSSRLAVTNRTLRSTEMVSESGVVGGGAAGVEGAPLLAFLQFADGSEQDWRRITIDIARSRA